MTDKASHVVPAQEHRTSLAIRTLLLSIMAVS
jgi:hypothetical protein